MPLLTVGQLASWARGRVIGEQEITTTGMVADSRAQVQGSGFAAVRGERVDGHSFVREALAGGARFIVVERDDAVPDGATAIVVDDTVRALGAMATGARATLDAHVVAITGSTGKTLTKDLVAAALRAKRRVHAAPASFNTDVTVPLVILGCPADAEVLVAELGARHPGDIGRLCEISKPHVGVITGIGSTHLEVFGSREAIAATKAELLESLPADGLAILPSNDDFLSLLSRSTSARVAAVGPGGPWSYAADRIDSDGVTYGRLFVDGRTIDVALPVPGRPLMRNAAFAVRVAMEIGVEPEAAALALAHAPLSAWRLQIEHIGPWLVVNDAYNANPTSMAATLRSVRELAAGRETWAVLGAMAELGEATGFEHERAGRLATGLGYGGVIVMGDEAARVAAGAGDRAHRVGSLADAADAVSRLVPAGSVVVVKASRAVGLERLTELLAEGPKVMER